MLERLYIVELPCTSWMTASTGSTFWGGRRLVLVHLPHVLFANFDRILGDKSHYCRTLYSLSKTCHVVILRRQRNQLKDWTHV